MIVFAILMMRTTKLRTEYEAKSMKHFYSGGKDAEDIMNNLAMM